VCLITLGLRIVLIHLHLCDSLVEKNGRRGIRSCDPDVDIWKVRETERMTRTTWIPNTTDPTLTPDISKKTYRFLVKLDLGSRAHSG